MHSLRNKENKWPEIRPLSTGKKKDERRDQRARDIKTVN